MVYGFMCCINYGEVMNKKDTRRDAWDRDYKPLNYEEFEKACAIEPKKNYSKWFLGIFYMCLIVFLLSSCTSLEVGVHYSKVVYNKCKDLDNWECLWYDENN